MTAHAAGGHVDRLEEAGKTAMLVAVDGKYAGHCRGGRHGQRNFARRRFSALQAMGIDVVMITGDNRADGEGDRRAGRHRARARRSAAGRQGGGSEKLQAARPRSWPWSATESTMRRRWPTADIGMAIGTGTDVAMEAADVTLMRGDLAASRRRFTMSRKTMRNIRQNLFWALVTIPSASRSPPSVAGPVGGRRGDGAQLGFRRAERASLAARRRSTIGNSGILLRFWPLQLGSLVDRRCARGRSCRNPAGAWRK